jgi:hypothetical protein
MLPNLQLDKNFRLLYCCRGIISMDDVVELRGLVWMYILLMSHQAGIHPLRAVLELSNTYLIICASFLAMHLSLFSQSYPCSQYKQLTSREEQHTTQPSAVTTTGARRRDQPAQRQ